MNGQMDGRQPHPYILQTIVQTMIRLLVRNSLILANILCLYVSVESLNSKLTLAWSSHILSLMYFILDIEQLNFRFIPL